MIQQCFYSTISKSGNILTFYKILINQTKYYSWFQYYINFLNHIVLHQLSKFYDFKIQKGETNKQYLNLN